MKGTQGWALRTILGALLIACAVAFLVLAALFVRDLALSAQARTADTQNWPPGIAVWEFCLN